MTTPSALKLAVGTAEKLLADRGIRQLPIDPRKIAEELGIVVEAKPETAKGVSGMLLRDGENYVILYATHIKSEGFRRFSIAHEIGHYCLAGHIDHVLPAGANVHESRAGFVSTDPFEREADFFAAGLLMPDPMFTRALIGLDDGLAAIEALAKLCCTSLTATAIRYAEKASTPVAVVMTTGGRVDYCFASGELEEFDDLRLLRKEDWVPDGSATDRFNGDPSNVREARRLTDETNLRSWFGCRRSVSATEEVVGLGDYGKTLTVISAAEFADDDPAGNDEELEDSYTPTFHKRRRR